MLLASLNPAAVADGADIGDAVRIDGAVLSRSDLVGAATSVAERVGGAQRVAVLAKPTATTVLAVTGCLIAGVPVVPVPADVGAAERRHILTDSGAQVWLGERPDEPEGLPHIPVRLHARSWHRYAEPPPEATALIMYTSGTTGPPKGVLVSRRPSPPTSTRWRRRGSGRPTTPWCTVFRCSTSTASCSACLGRCESETASCTPENPRLPTTPAAQGIAVLRGADGVVASRRRPRRREGVVLGATAGVGQRGAAGAGVRQARRTHRPPTRRAVRRQRDPDHREHPRCGERRPGWVGLPLHGVQTRLVDDDGAPSPHDGETIGRLQVQTPTMFDGYLNRPEATAEAFDDDGWYRTGDAAVIDGDGMHRIVGRESVDLIKTGGYRVGAGEIETVLLGHPGVAEAAVVGLPDDDLGQRIVAFIVGDAEPEALINYVAEQLSVT